MDFVSRGGELLKRTRKGNDTSVSAFRSHKRYFNLFCCNVLVDTGDLHWKLVSININSSWQV